MRRRGFLTRLMGGLGAGIVIPKLVGSGDVPVRPRQQGEETEEPARPMTVTRTGYFSGLYSTSMPGDALVMMKKHVISGLSS